jgi:hypothetical protein
VLGPETREAEMHQRTVAPRCIKVSINTAVWIVGERAGRDGAA